MDGIEELKGVLVLAATNRKDLIDPALLRSGRFDLILEMPIPDEQTRKQIFKVHTTNMVTDPDVDFTMMARETEAMVGADIEFICRKASLFAIREIIENNLSVSEDLQKCFKVSEKHFEKAINLVKTQNSIR